jgi:hypothetical protein
MKNYFIETTCPSCSQGRLVISVDETNSRIYLHCEECEMGWLHPEEVSAKKPGFLTLLEDFDAHSASLEEIQNYGWYEFIHSNFET